MGDFGEQSSDKPRRRVSTRTLGAAVVAAPVAIMLAPNVAHAGSDRFVKPTCAGIGQLFPGNTRHSFNMSTGAFATLNCSLHRSGGFMTAGASPPHSSSTRLSSARAAIFHNAAVSEFAWCVHDGYHHRHEVSCKSTWF
jgi:hypothetical protein